MRNEAPAGEVQRQHVQGSAKTKKCELGDLVPSPVRRERVRVRDICAPRLSGAARIPSLLCIYLARYLTGEEADRIAVGR